MTVIVAMCAASAGAHAALVPQHLDHEPRLGIAFVAATAVLLAAATALTYRPDAAVAVQAATVAIGLLFAIDRAAIRGGRGSLTHKEARS